MPSLNYKKQFAGKVESGEKRQTIRARRKDGKDPRPGQTLYHFYGLRTKYCRKLREDVCKSTEAITIEGRHNVVVGTITLSLAAETNLANADGFYTSIEFFDFFEKTHGFPFHGLIIKW
ncbi:hypothetical protein [Desulfobacter vibrioformis]|uniref:hypothetical protein n=1 Tax=Desulfobacter vibrioformis TaxID=34031 RepID=UPI0005537184|nr:hypothetical protein [Desulfobacter vibrioformis]